MMGTDRVQGYTEGGHVRLDNVKHAVEHETHYNALDHLTAVQQTGSVLFDSKFKLI